MRKPKFEIFEGSDKIFYYRLKAANGEPIMSGRGYRSKPAVIHGIAHVIASGTSEIQFTRKTSANFKYYFQLRSKSGKVIGWSELYNSKQGRDNGIRAVMTACKFGNIKDLA